MARIENSKVKETSGGYHRIFDNKLLGNLISRVHATSISAGTELEKLVMERVQNTIENLDEFLHQTAGQDGVFVASKKQVKNCKSFDNSKKAEPDMVVFRRQAGKSRCYVIELKDGHIFDTKKASAEHAMLHNFVERNGPRIQYTTSCHICCFNTEDTEAIYHGFKKKIPRHEILTGGELSDLLEIDYQEILSVRKKDGEQNIMFFIKELLKIEKIRGYIRDFLNE